VREVEGGEILAAGKFGTGRAPVEASGNHQVKDQPEVIVFVFFVTQADGNALPNTAEFANFVVFDI
jgi:hypothetical protein